MRLRSAPLGADRRVCVLVTDRRDGDLAISTDPDQLERRRRAIVDRQWVWTRQVHGAGVLVIDADSDVSSGNGTEADAIVTLRTDVAIAAHSADCATVALWAPEGVIGVVHAGWRGLLVDVIGAAVTTMRSLGATTIRAATGPSIGPECYEFGADDLAELRAELGDSVVAVTATGAPALDVRAAVAGRLDQAGVVAVDIDDRCTGCEAEQFWSHRIRSDTARQALVVWSEP